MTDNIMVFQITELSTQIAAYETDVKALILRAGRAAVSAPPTPSTSNAVLPIVDAGDEEQGEQDGDQGSDTSNDDYEDRFLDLEEALANVVADVHDLGKWRAGYKGETAC